MLCRCDLAALLFNNAQEHLRACYGPLIIAFLSHSKTFLIKRHGLIKVSFVMCIHSKPTQYIRQSLFTPFSQSQPDRTTFLQNSFGVWKVVEICSKSSKVVEKSGIYFGVIVTIPLHTNL